MIGVLVASKLEWKTLLDIYKIDDSNLEKYPYGEFYRTIFNGKDIVYFRSGIKKINAACSAQYMIDRFDLSKIIVIGTCAASNDNYDYLDVLVPQRVIDYDIIIRELTEELPDEVFIDIPTPNITSPYVEGILGTSDKALVLWEDLKYLASNNIDASDSEAYAVCQVAIKNNIDFCILKGITDRPVKGADEFDEQIDVYEENTPIVMKKIIEDYLPEVF